MNSLEPDLSKCKIVCCAIILAAVFFGVMILATACVYPPPYVTPTWAHIWTQSPTRTRMPTQTLEVVKTVCGGTILVCKTATVEGGVR